MKHHDRVISFFILYLHFFLLNSLYSGGNNNGSIPHGPSVTVAQVKKNTEDQFAGLLAITRQAPILDPDVYLQYHDQSTLESYYSKRGINSQQAGALYKKNPTDFQVVYNKCNRIAAQSNDSVAIVLKNYLDGESLDALEQRLLGVESKPITASQKRVAANRQQSQTSINKTAQNESSKKNLVSKEITIDQQRSLPQTTTAVVQSSISSKQSKQPMIPSNLVVPKVSQGLQERQQSVGALTQTIGNSREGRSQGGVPQSIVVAERPKKIFWTRSFLSVLPYDVEKRADTGIKSIASNVSQIVSSALDLVSIPRLKKDTNIKDNNAQKFTLLDAADWVLNCPLVRMGLESTIIGPLDQNKDLKMRQFIIMLLVTYYNSYKLSFTSPLGALNFAVNRILLPIKVTSSSGLVAKFLMQQAFIVFNQYNLNGGDLGQAVSNQSFNLFLGHVGNITGLARSGLQKTKSSISTIGTSFRNLFRKKE